MATTKKKAASKNAPKKKTAARAKKPAAAKAVAPKAAAPKAAAPLKAVSDPFTKSALFNHIAERTELKRKDVAAVFDELANVINAHVKKRGAGQFTLPGLAKIKVVRKPATRARKGVNPFTGEETVFKAKPARNVVKLQPLKGLKDMVK
ncbi:HU family DNA-binding protein [Ectothiorhodospiraceae bacterium 2226]|nr:HU family DNA-binding protein [Ectothiorhodospiraceae bacterium 2226]